MPAFTIIHYERLIDPKKKDGPTEIMYRVQASSQQLGCPARSGYIDIRDPDQLPVGTTFEAEAKVKELLTDEQYEAMLREASDAELQWFIDNPPPVEDEEPELQMQSHPFVWSFVNARITSLLKEGLALKITIRCTAKRFKRLATSDVVVTIAPPPADRSPDNLLEIALQALGQKGKEKAEAAAFQNAEHAGMKDAMARQA